MYIHIFTLRMCLKKVSKCTVTSESSNGARLSEPHTYRTAGKNPLFIYIKTEKTFKK